MVFRALRFSSETGSEQLITRRTQGGQVRYTHCVLTGAPNVPEGLFVMEAKKPEDSDWCQIVTLNGQKPSRKVELLVDDLELRVRCLAGKRTGASSPKSAKWTVDMTGFLEDPEPVGANPFMAKKTSAEQCTLSENPDDIVHISNFAIYNVEEFPLKGGQYLFEIQNDNVWSVVGCVSKSSTAHADLYALGSTVIRCRRVGVAGQAKPFEWGFSGFTDQYHDEVPSDDEDDDSTSDDEAAVSDDDDDEDNETEAKVVKAVEVVNTPMEIEGPAAASSAPGATESATVQKIDDSDDDDDDDEESDDDDDDDDDEGEEEEAEKALKEKMSAVFQSRTAQMDDGSDDSDEDNDATLVAKAVVEGSDSDDDDDDDSEGEDSDDESEAEAESAAAAKSKEIVAEPVVESPSKKRKAPEPVVSPRPTKKVGKDVKESTKPVAATSQKESTPTAKTPEDEYAASIVKFIKSVGGSAKLPSIGSKVKRPAKANIGKLNAFLKSRKEFKVTADAISLA